MDKRDLNHQSQNNKSSLGISLKKVYERFIKIRGDPRNIALGFALGLFVGMSPTFGFQTAIAIFLAALFKWNKISAAAGVWITNPITTPFIYGMTYLAGAKILGMNKANNPIAEFNIEAIGQILYKAPGIFWSLTVGGVVLGLPLAVVGYYFSYKVIGRYQADIKRKIAKQKEKLASKKERIKDKLHRKKDIL
jgi:uncharacterized protein (DUF2062 family)